MISSKEDKPITSLSPFIIEKQIESIIGTPKNVNKINGTLLVETNRKSQTDNLLKLTKFFNINVTVTEHKTLNSCKGIIRDRMLKHETETETVHKHSRLKQVDHNRDPGPGQLTRKEKMEKKKIKIKHQIHIVKGRRPIRSSWSIGSIPLRTWS